MGVTPRGGTVSSVTTGGIPVQPVPANPAGGFIENPLTAVDQGLDPAATPEPIYISPVTDATLAGNGSTFAIQPGGSWTIIPGQTTPTSVNAASDGHKFSAVYWT